VAVAPGEKATGCWRTRLAAPNPAGPTLRLIDRSPGLERKPRRSWTDANVRRAQLAKSLEPASYQDWRRPEPSRSKVEEYSKWAARGKSETAFVSGGTDHRRPRFYGFVPLFLRLLRSGRRRGLPQNVQCRCESDAFPWSYHCRLNEKWGADGDPHRTRNVLRPIKMYGEHVPARQANGLGAGPKPKRRAWKGGGKARETGQRLFETLRGPGSTRNSSSRRKAKLRLECR